MRSRKHNNLRRVRRELKNDQNYMGLLYDSMSETKRNSGLSNDLGDVINWHHLYKSLKRKYFVADNRCKIDYFAILYLEMNRGNK